MCWTEEKDKITKNKKELSQELKEPERKLWRHFTHWTLP